MSCSAANAATSAVRSATSRERRTARPRSRRRLGPGAADARGCLEVAFGLLVIPSRVRVEYGPRRLYSISQGSPHLSPRRWVTRSREERCTQSLLCFDERWYS